LHSRTQVKHFIEPERDEDKICLVVCVCVCVYARVVCQQEYLIRRERERDR
jgi:hypothetical protein